MSRIVAFPELTGEQLVDLQRLLRSRSTPAGMQRRASLIWELAAGSSLAEARSGRSALSQRSSLGATVPGLGSQRVGGGPPLGTPAQLRHRSHHRDSAGGDRPSWGSGAGIHNLVSAQVGGVSAATAQHETLGTFHYPPALARGRVALPGGSNLVPEYGPKFRGKKTKS